METFKGDAIVAFVDLLGFSNEIIGKWHEKESNINPLDRLLAIRKIIESEFSPEVRSSFTDESGGEIFTHDTQVKVLSVSDSFSIIMPFEEGETLIQKIGKLFMVAGAINSLWRHCINQGFTIRGGIDIGEIYFSGMDIIGPTFINAYLIESKIAKTSRIILSNKSKELIREYLAEGRSEFLEYLALWFDLDSDKHLIMNPIIAFESKEEIIMDGIKQLRSIRDKAGITLYNKYTSLLIRLEARKISMKDNTKFENSQFIFR